MKYVKKLTKIALGSLTLSAIGLWSGVSLAAPVQELRLAQEAFTESYASNVPVSGRILVGVVYASPNLSGNLAVRVPQVDLDQPICLKVHSRDGSYSSENEYRMAAAAEAELYSVEYPSKHTDVLNKLSADEMAMVAVPGSCEQSNSIQQVYLSYRGEEPGGKVYVFANSGRSDVFMQLQLDSGNQNHRCQAIKQGVRTGYDTLCEIDPALLRDGSNAITLVRRQAGRMLPPVKFELVY